MRRAASPQLLISGHQDENGVIYNKGPVVVNVPLLAAEHCLVTTGSPPLSLVRRIGCVNTERNATKRAHLHGCDLLSHRASTAFSALQFLLTLQSEKGSPFETESGCCAYNGSQQAANMVRSVAMSPGSPKPKLRLDNIEAKIKFEISGNAFKAISWRQLSTKYLGI